MENQQLMQEDEIDLSQYIKAIAKHKKTFLAVFLLILAAGIAYILFSPKIYRASMMIQPPVVGPSLSGANDLETAENLKGLIVNGVYNEKLKKISNIDSEIGSLNFKVKIPDKTNILKVSIDLEGRKKELGVDLLQGLSKTIFNSFVKSIGAKVGDILNQIKSNERAIISTKEKAKNLQEQIKEISLREDKLLEELKAVTLNAKEVWEKRDIYLKESAPSGNSPALFLASYLQNNSNYLNQLNNQSSELSIRRANLGLEFKNIEVQVSNYQTEIDKLNINKDFISNIKIIAQPKISPGPVSPNKKKTIAISIAIGLFSGLLAVFLQEFWVNNLVKK